MNFVKKIKKKHEKRIFSLDILSSIAIHLVVNAHGGILSISITYFFYRFLIIFVSYYFLQIL